MPITRFTNSHSSKGTMSKSILSFLVKAAVVAAPLAAAAEPAQEFRCASDSLDPTAALQRIEWARKCGLLGNTGGANSWVNSNKAFDTTFAWAKEYIEVNPNRAFTGNLNAYNVNYYYSTAKWEATPMYTVAQETLGPTAAFWKWTGITARPRPMYPSFENTPVAGSGTQLFPHPTLADCNLYTDHSGSAAAKWTTDRYVIAYCESSCYTPDQSLSFSTGEVNIVDAMKARRDDVVTLASDATLDRPATQVSRVYSYTTEIRDAEHIIYKLTTQSGGKLSVTNEHPIVIGNGSLVQAQKLRVGDELLKADGTPDAVARIEKTTYFGKVYNIKPMSRELVANILVAQGYLVGSARFQNDYVDYMNRVLLFRGVPDGVMPR
jgi:hypothetical protein